MLRSSILSARLEDSNSSYSLEGYSLGISFSSIRLGIILSFLSNRITPSGGLNSLITTYSIALVVVVLDYYLSRTSISFFSLLLRRRSSYTFSIPYRLD